MRVAIQKHNVQVNEDLRAHIERRLQFALSRFGRLVRRVAVHLGDTNGTRGCVDKRCCIEVSLTPSGSVRAEDTDADFFPAVANAADRVGRSVGRELERRRESRSYVPLSLSSTEGSGP